MQGRTWKDVQDGIGQRNRTYPLEHCASRKESRALMKATQSGSRVPRSPTPRKGDALRTPSNSTETVVLEAWEYVDSRAIFR